MSSLLTLSSVILDSLSDGVYVCDRERTIVYWSASAERITGWTSQDVLGRRCLDEVLCHVDKDGHQLCGKEFCPLHRSMITGATSEVPLIVFAKGKDGQRIPMHVSVAPIRDPSGEVIGGVEMFRDVSSVLADLQRAKRIQSLSLAYDLPNDERVRFATHYAPHDIVGGDYLALRKLDADRYGFFLADVMGHGVAAALHTMHLSALSARHQEAMAEPVRFAETINNELCRIVKGESFATAICGVIDAEARTLRFCSAGGPPLLAVRADGTYEELECSGVPLGVMEGAPYDEGRAEFSPGDRLVLYSDGAAEIHNAEGEMLGVSGLIGILKDLGYPASKLPMSVLEERLLLYSNAIRLDDDVTLIEVEFREG